MSGWRAGNNVEFLYVVLFLFFISWGWHELRSGKLEGLEPLLLILFFDSVYWVYIFQSVKHYLLANLG